MGKSISEWDEVFHKVVLEHESKLKKREEIKEFGTKEDLFKYLNNPKK
jgi:hypothetical protein